MSGSKSDGGGASEHVDPRSGWVRQRTFELQQPGVSYDAAREQAEAEADEEFGSEDCGNGNGATA